MSTINTRPTFHYSQPEEYRFSHDSVFLAQVVFDEVKHKITPEMRILDLCAGCGIVGLDFMFHSRKELGFNPKQVDFLEIQEEYIPHFKKNVEALGIIDSELKFMNKNYSDLLSGESNLYDLILCNPPYFADGQGTLSPSEFKNRCRFFMDSDFETLVQSALHVLKPSGAGYLLVRNEKSVGVRVGDIRGTPLIKIQKN